MRRAATRSISKRATACSPHIPERSSGPFPPDRGVAIMVTMPSEAADDYSSCTTGRARHGLHAHQLRARRRGGVGADDRPPAPRREATGRELPRADGSGRSQTSYRPARTGPAVVKVTPDAGCVRPRHSTRANLAHRSGSAAKPPTPADAVARVSRRVSGAARGRRPPDVHGRPRRRKRRLRRRRRRCRRLLGRVDDDLLPHAGTCKLHGEARRWDGIGEREASAASPPTERSDSRWRRATRSS